MGNSQSLAAKRHSRIQQSQYAGSSYGPPSPDGTSRTRSDTPPPYSPSSSPLPSVPSTQYDTKRPNGEAIYTRPGSVIGVNLAFISSRSRSRSRTLRAMSLEALSPDYLRAPMRQQSKENALDTLRQYDTVILMDDSGSMVGDRWQEATRALAALANTAAEYDQDGIDVYFLNAKYSGKGLKDCKKVEQLFQKVQPSGITPIGGALENLILPYLRKVEKAKKRLDKGETSTLQIKPINIIVITDGAPTDEPDVVIKNAARRLDTYNAPLTQLGIQFVQVGDDKKATEYLQKLDDDLGGTHDIRDIVDTTPYLGTEITAEMLIKVLLGGINRRVDRKGAAAVLG